MTGQTLKYHKVELTRPDVVVAFQRGSEMEPLVGLLRRFLSANVLTIAVPTGVLPMSPEERMELRASRFVEALREPLQRWRVRPTVFAPSLPAGFDLSRLDRLIVGVHDRSGRCLGLGVLEFEESGLRVRTSSADGMAGLRIGSARLDPGTLPHDHGQPARGHVRVGIVAGGWWLVAGGWWLVKVRHTIHCCSIVFTTND